MTGYSTSEDPYGPLRMVLEEALAQASDGKGKERHTLTPTQNFLEQPIVKISEHVGVGFPLGQAVKKIYETTNLDNIEHKVHELLGAINYIAAAIIVLRKG